MKYAVFSVSTPEWSPEEVVSQLSSQGWDGVEWAIKDFPPAPVPSFRAGNRAVWSLERLAEESERMKNVTLAGNLEISALGGYVMAHEREGVTRLLSIAAEIGVTQVRIPVPHIRSAPYAQLLEETRRDYEWVAGQAAQFGVKALLEVHHRLISSSASSAMKILEGLDPSHVGIIHDVGNTVIEGQEDYLASFEMMGPYLAHIHVKNTRWQALPERRPDGGLHFVDRWASLWDGIANIRAYFEALRRIGYDAWVTVEDFTEELPLEERTRENLAYLKRVESQVAEIPAELLCHDEHDYMLGGNLKR